MAATRLIVPLVVVLAAGCASAANPSGSRDSRSIEPEEIRATHYGTALEVVNSLRPLWRTRHGGPRLVDGSPGEVVVYVDNIRWGGWADLRQLAATDLESIRFLTATQAQARYGIGHRAGAILVTTRHG